MEFPILSSLLCKAKQFIVKYLDYITQTHGVLFCNSRNFLSQIKTVICTHV